MDDYFSIDHFLQAGVEQKPQFSAAPALTYVEQPARNRAASSAADSESDEEEGYGKSLASERAFELNLKKTMDEDERLLASEEGKKLSSKERRQLRNKVSARHFRLRRKEYITHLEELVAQKSNEAQSLKSDNERLAMENKRLADALANLTLSPASSEASYLSPTPEFIDQPQLTFDFPELETFEQQQQPARIMPRIANLLPTFTRKDANPNIVEWPLAYPTSSSSANDPIGNMQVFNTLVPESLAELEKEPEETKPAEADEQKTTITVEVLSSKPDKEVAVAHKDQEGIWEDARKAAEEVYKRLGLTLAGLSLDQN